MAGCVVRWSLILAFAAAVGHVAWHAVLGPPLPPEYSIEGDGSVLWGNDPEAKVLYLRRTLVLSQRPRHAWLEVVGRDRIHIYVNGEKATEKSRDGFLVGAIVDLAPFMKAGRNVLAIKVEQATIGFPPEAAVQGGYTLASETHPIRGDASWRSSAFSERGTGEWLSVDFRDEHWQPARVTPGSRRSIVDRPPRATTEASIARWITSPSLATRAVALRRDIEVSGRPRQAWLRVTATAPYVLAVNGTVIDDPSDELASKKQVTPVQRTYDLTAHFRRGQNVLAVLLTGNERLPHLLADCEVEEEGGTRQRIGTDGQWLSRSGLPPDWAATTPAGSSDWQPCVAETGDLNILPWVPIRRLVIAPLPVEEAVRSAAGQLGVMAILAVLAALGCRFAGRLLARLRLAGPGATAPVAYLALLPATLALAGAVLASYDPRISRQEIYRGLWVWLAFASVLLQWGLLALAARGSTARWSGLTLGRSVALGLLLAMMVGGFYLRIRNIGTEPLFRDELHVYEFERGMLERGYPSTQFHPDVPVKEVGAGELIYVFNAMADLVFHDPIYAVRFPSVCFGTAMIGLLYVVGRRLFGNAVGWLAAAFYTLSPVCIAMSNYGRYFEQSQFFALLTVFFFWLTLRGRGPLNRRYLWLTAVSYCALFLTWEGAGLIAVGMIAAAVVERRGSLYALVCNRSVWLGMGTVLVVLGLQHLHRELERHKFLEASLVLSTMTVAPVWRYPTFEPWYLVRDSAWISDTLIPLLGLVLAGLLAVRHAYRKRLRFLLLIHVTTCVLMASLLSVQAWRYSHYLVPLLILMASASFVAVARALVRYGRSSSAPVGWQLYAGGLGLVLVLTVFVLGCGHTVLLPELRTFHSQAYNTSGFKFPIVDGPTLFLRGKVREGDAVLSTNSRQVMFLMTMPRGVGIYQPANAPPFPLEFTDTSDAAIDGNSGAQMITSRQELEDLFARHDRIWCVANTTVLALWNTDDVSSYIRDHMEVVYEDFGSVLLFRGNRHWPAAERQQGPHGP